MAALATTARERYAVKNRKGFDGFVFTASTALLIYYVNWNEGDGERNVKIYSDTGEKVRLLDIGADASERFCTELLADKITVAPKQLKNCDYLKKCLQEEQEEQEKENN